MVREYVETLSKVLTVLPKDASQLREVVKRISEEHGLQLAYNLLKQLEVIANMRKPTMAIFDHTGHIIGGGQKYGFTVAYALQDTFDITLIVNQELSHQQILDWYNLDLSKCKIKVVRIPFFDQFDSVQLDPGKVTKRMENPFHIISRESGNYDFFINNSMNEMVYPMANLSYLICHFPERRPKSYFYADQYTGVIFNSKYTAHWISKKWKFSPHKHIYPPVDMEITMEGKKIPKECIILSVARFEAGGSKKQLEMVRVFNKLNRKFSKILKGWRLFLVGGSPDENPYLQDIKDLLKKGGHENIELKVNISDEELKSIYKRSKIFWHLCGLEQKDPALVEHFGMTIVESMQNGLVPIVFDGGGQREIVEQDKNGYRINSSAMLIKETMHLINNPQVWQKMSKNALERGKVFSRSNFEKNVKDFFNKELQNFTNIQGK
jgi:glycosyltransferase involved in cell wall biosynthesis